MTFLSKKTTEDKMINSVWVRERSTTHWTVYFFVVIYFHYSQVDNANQMDRFPRNRKIPSFDRNDILLTQQITVYPSYIYKGIPWKLRFT